MRKETALIVNAFMQGNPAAAARTITDGRGVFLHGNKIFWRDDTSPNVYHFSMCGWATPTTRDRINGLLYALWADGFKAAGKPLPWGKHWRVSQRNHAQYFHGPQGAMEIDACSTYTIAI